MIEENESIKEFVYRKNKNKPLFTAGPSSLLKENLLGLSPCFGRGDEEYLKIENFVLDKLNNISGQKETIRLQGSGSLAIEIMILNFLSGNVFVLNNGFYADRIVSIIKRWKNEINIHDLVISDSLIKKSKYQFDWIIACPTETSNGILNPIKELKKFASAHGARLMLDATASIGLEENHELADVCSYSSCKGLFGLTGASFVSFKTDYNSFEKSFYLNIKTHIDREVTGPYHSILSLSKVLEKHKFFKRQVEEQKKEILKKFSYFLIWGNERQPNLCTALNKKVNYNNPKSLIYLPRKTIAKSIICHIGAVGLTEEEQKKMIEIIN